VLVDEAVTANHVAQVSRAGPASVDKGLEGEREKLLKMEEEIARRVGSAGGGRGSDRGQRARASLQTRLPPDRLLHVLRASKRRQDPELARRLRRPVR
jgi:hypothetical protein